MSAAIAPLFGASPTGSDAMGWVWSAAAAATLALLGSTAKRGPLIVGALLAAVLARDVAAIAFASIAVVAALVSTRHLHRRAIFERGMAGGATSIALLVGVGDVSPALAVLIGGASVGCIAVSGLARTNPRTRQQLKWAAISLGVAWVVAGALAAIGFLTVADPIDSGVDELTLGLAAARAGDAPTAAAHLERAATALGRASADLRPWGLPARAMPVLSQHVTAVVQPLGSAALIADQAALVAELLADEALSFRAGQVDLDALTALANPVERFRLRLDELVRQVEGTSSDPLLPPLRQRLDDVLDEAARAERDAATAETASELLPELLGAQGPRRYLVVFTTPAEARGRLGFPGSYAEVTFDDGRLVLGDRGSSSEDLTEVVVDQGAIDVGSPQVRPYLAFGATRSFRSATIPPHFPASARLLAEIWEQSGRPPIDGVLRLDPASLAGLLRFIGPITVEGRAAPLTFENLEQYLLLGQYQEFPSDQSPRRELLGTVADLTFDRLTSTSLPPPSLLAQTFGPLVRQGHLSFFSFGERSTTEFLERLGLTGAFDRPASDGLMVTSVNSIGNKIDSFLQRSIRYDGRVEGRSLSAEITISLANTAPSRGLPNYVIGSSVTPAPPRGTNRTTLLVYTACPARSAVVDGSPESINSEFTDGWWLQRLELELAAGAAREVRLDVECELGDAPYSLDLVPGGGVAPDPVEVSVRHSAGLVAFDGVLSEAQQLRPG